MASPRSGTPSLERLRKDPTAPACRTLLEVLRTPLMTSLARAAYSDTAADPAILLDGGFAGHREIEDHLLDAFIPAAFAGPVTLGTRQRRRGPRPADAERWLRFLARHLDRLGTRDLEWWRLPSAVPPPVRWLAPGVVGWITVGAAFGAISGSALAWLLGACGAVGLMIGLAVVTARRPSAQSRVPGRLRVMLRRLGYVAITAVLAGIITGSTARLDLGYFLLPVDADGMISWLGFSLLAGLALGVVLGAAGIDAQQAPTTTPLRLQRKARALSRRLPYGIGYGLLNGILVGIALWAAWGLGYAATVALRLEAVPAFPPGGVVRSMPDGGSHADYPGGLRYVVTGKGRKYVILTGKTVSYAGYSGGAFDGYYEKRADCLAGEEKCSASSLDVIRSDGAGGLIATGAAGSGELYDDGVITGWLNPLRLSDIGASIGFTGIEALFLLVPASLAGGLLLWLGFPADIAQAISPSSTMRADRNAAILRGVILALLVLLPLLAIGLASDYIGRPGAASSVAQYVVLIVALGLLAITLSAWLRLQVARACLATLGRLPWRLMSFLEDAHARGALRQAGAVYQFRHVRLQERLAARPKNRANADVSTARSRTIARWRSRTRPQAHG